MNWFKISIVFLTFIVTGCRSYSLEDVFRNNFSIDWEKEDFELTPEQTEVFSQVIARGFIAGFIRQLRSNEKIIMEIFSSRKVPELKGFPIFPNLPANICFNASSWTIPPVPIPGVEFRYHHERLTDFQILGMNGSVDSLDIYVNYTEDELPISLGWTIETPLIQILGDNRFELDILGMVVVFQATNSRYEVHDHFLQFMAMLDLFPLNEKMSFLALDITFESADVSWVADYLINFNGTGDIIGEQVELRNLTKALEFIWRENKGPILQNATDLIHSIVGRCSVLDLLNVTQGCSDLFQDHNLYSLTEDIENFGKLFDTLIGDGLGVNECPARDDGSTTTEEVTSDATTASTPTTTPPTTTPSDAVRTSGSQTLSILVTSSLMYMISRFVCA